MTLLIVGGALFVPSVILIARLKNYTLLAKPYAADDFWKNTWYRTWEAMIVMLLPIGITLAAGLLAQIEVRANAWKQVIAAPQSLSRIYFAKLAVLLTLLTAVFLLFNAAIYVTSIIPSVLISGVPYPPAPIPWSMIGRENLQYFVACLPAVGLQFALSLHFRNFMVPLAVGFGIWILGVGLLSWEFSWAFPFLPGVWEYLANSNFERARVAPVDLNLLSFVYFAVFTTAGWAAFVFRDDKG